MTYSINSRCDGCSACYGQCPTEAIHGVFKRRYSIRSDLCIDCGVCGMICPIESVLDEQGRLAQFIPRDRRPRPVVDPDLCTACGTCVHGCPFDCRMLVGSPHAGLSVLVAPERCVSCAECEKGCNKDAISMQPVDLRTCDADTEVMNARLLLGQELR